jgi:hypothetical protein
MLVGANSLARLVLATQDRSKNGLGMTTPAAEPRHALCTTNRCAHVKDPNASLSLTELTRAYALSASADGQAKQFVTIVTSGKLGLSGLHLAGNDRHSRTPVPAFQDPP